MGKPWRAMILKDNDGDVGIALASWEGFVAGKPGVKGVPGSQGQTGVAGTPGVKGDPGHFELKYLNLRSGEVTKIKLPADGDKSRRFQCHLGSSRAVTDLANGMIAVR